MTLDWSPAGDSETLQRTLTYNVRIGTSPGLSNILNPMAIESTGLRKIAQMGNAYHNTDWTYNLDPVTRYYWSVQTIDQAFAGSPFAAEQNFMTGLGVGIEENTAPELPEKFLLHQNYPNPFNPVTLIRYSVPVASQVTLKVYDTLGKEIITLVNQQHTRGYYDIVFSGEDLESGVYLVRMTADGYTGTQKMVLIK